MRVPSVSTQFGFHSGQTQVFIERKLKYDWASWYYYANAGPWMADIGYSLRNPPVQGDRVFPTDYVRKVVYMRSLSGCNLNNGPQTWQVSSESGIPFFNINLTSWGSPWYDQSVFLPIGMENDVIQKCQLAIMDLKANLYEDFGQAKQSMQQLVSLFNLIVLSSRDMLRGNFAAAFKRIGKAMPRNVKDVAKMWLAYYYGIKPMVSTFDAICAPRKARRKSITKASKTRQGLNAAEIQGSDYVIFEGGKAEAEAMCQMTVTVDLSDDLNYWTSLGLTDNWANDLIVTAWALTPLSFVIDWVLPVEQFLRTRSWSSALFYHGGFTARKITVDANFLKREWIHYATEKEPVTARGTFPRVNIRGIQYQRISQMFPPPSGLAIRRSLSTQNVVNASALLLARS